MPERQPLDTGNMLFGRPSNFADFEKAIFDATPDCIKVLSIDGNLLKINKSGQQALGISPDAELGMRWLSILPEEVREAGANALAVAASGMVARFPGKSVSPEGMRHWDNLLVPVMNPDQGVASILCVSRDVTQQTLLEERLEAGAVREALIAREMQHRVKNVFAVVSGLVLLSQKEAAAAGDAGQIADILRAKLSALSRASDAALLHSAEPVDMRTGIDLETIVAGALSPYGQSCTYRGEAVLVQPEMMTTIALLLHELATNAVKYGALGPALGMVDVSWSVDANTVILRWRETGAVGGAVAPTKTGFGTKMIERIVTSAGGRIMRDWRPEGLAVDVILDAGT